MWNAYDNFLWYNVVKDPFQGFLIILILLLLFSNSFSFFFFFFCCIPLCLWYLKLRWRLNTLQNCIFKERFVCKRTNKCLFWECPVLNVTFGLNFFNLWGIIRLLNVIKVLLFSYHYFCNKSIEQIVGFLTFLIMLKYFKKRIYF